MTATRRLANASPKPSEVRFGHGFLGRFVLVGGGTAFLLLLGVVATTGPLPSWLGLIGAIGGVSLSLGILAGLFGDRLVDWWLKLIRFFARP